MFGNSPTSTDIPQTLLDLFVPDYRAFVEAQQPATRVPFHTIEWSPEYRQIISSAPPPDLGQAAPIAVGSTRTFDLGKFKVLVSTPMGERPSEGWPVLLFIHGGGYLLGNAETGISFFSRACVEAKCVVVSVDYRLAPEHPYPAAIDDCWNAFEWLRGTGKEELGLDTSRVAVAGVSSGGTLSAVIAQRASLASPRIPLVLQILIVPGTDMTFTVDDKSKWTPSMLEYQNVWALRALDMLWLRDHYLPNVEDRAKPDASPLLQEDDKAYEGLAPALVIVTEFDILKSEGIMYAEKMRERGVTVTLKEVKGLSHLGLSADHVCEISRAVRAEEIDYLKKAFSK
ncbi:Lipase esterase, partial [Rhizoctonia solani]